MTVVKNIGIDGTEVSFVDFPSSVESGDNRVFSFEVNVGNADSETELNAEVSAFLYISGENTQSIVASTSAQVTEQDIITGSLSHTFETSDTFNNYPRTDSPVWIQVTVDYFGEPGFSQGTVDENANTDGVAVEVTKPTDSTTVDTFESGAAVSGESNLQSTFQNRTPFSIKDIEYEDDATYLESIYINDQRQIRFDDYPNPTISIDTAGRFAKHEIIGGTTVRQKIGEDPINISINGVCKRQTANQIDSLRDAKHGKIFSDRLPGGNDGLRVQFGSTMTEPMEDGGAADLTDGKYLYSYQINAIEVIR